MERLRGGLISLLDLSDRVCRFPIGHPNEASFGFCGADVQKGFVYCAEHCGVAYQTPEQRKRSAQAYVQSQRRAAADARRAER